MVKKEGSACQAVESSLLIPQTKSKQLMIANFPDCLVIYVGFFGDSSFYGEK